MKRKIIDVDLLDIWLIDLGIFIYRKMALSLMIGYLCCEMRGLQGIKFGYCGAEFGSMDLIFDDLYLPECFCCAFMGEFGNGIATAQK